MVAPAANHTTSNGTGSVDLAELNLVLAAFGKSIGDTDYQVEADFNADGAINLQDLNIQIAQSSKSIARGHLSASGNIMGYAGYIFEPATGMYVVRNRWYSTENGRWLSRDSLGYVDGQNLYEYVRSRPVVLVDPSGFGAICRRKLAPRTTLPSVTIPSRPVREISPLPAAVEPFRGLIPERFRTPEIVLPEIEAQAPPIRIPLHDDMGLWHDHVFFDDCEEPRNVEFFPDGLREDIGYARDVCYHCDIYTNDAALRVAVSMCEAMQPFCNEGDGYTLAPIPLHTDYGIDGARGNCQTFARRVKDNYVSLTTPLEFCIRWEDRSERFSPWGPPIRFRVCVEYITLPTPYEPNPPPHKCEKFEP